MDHGATLRRRFFIQQHPVTPRTQQICLDNAGPSNSLSLGGFSTSPTDHYLQHYFPVNAETIVD